MVGLEEPVLDDEARKLLREVQPLGVILFARNMPDRETLLTLTAALREENPNYLLAIDHEGGRVDRMPSGFTKMPPALQMAACADPGMLRKAGRLHASELRAAGFDVNFAPVLDVHTNPDNPVIGDRSFGTTPEQVIHNALPYLQGLAEGGVIGCGKHFPGHGDTGVDSHLELPSLPARTHTLERLRTLEMRPFARAISDNIPMLMTAHVLCEALDAENPATLSRKVIEECLRRELGYDRVVVSDDMEMGAIVKNYSMGEAAVQAIAAGCDLLLVCRRPELIREAHEGLVRAIESNALEPYRIAEASRRRSKLLERRRKMAKKFRGGTECIGCDEHARLSEALFEAKIPALAGVS